MPAAVREAIVGPDIVVDSTVLKEHSVIVRDDRIEAVVPIAQLPDDLARRDVGPGLLTPGLIDVHTHGAGLRGFNEGTVDANETALAAYLAAGITTVLPSLSTAPLDEMLGALEALSAPRPELSPRVPGVHLEGPYFSYEQRGAQNADALRVPSDGSIDRLLDYADLIKMISFAPELPGAVELTERLVGLGIIAAAGHSDGEDEDLWACQRAGLSHVIHIVSGQSTTIRKGPWRRPGMLEATLASEDLTVEMIGDGKHLPATLMRLAQRCLSGRLCLISDSTPGAGMPEGTEYKLGVREFVVEGGVGVTMDRTAFAGSTTLLSEMIPITVNMLGIDVAEVIAMATSVPAKAMRLPDVGRIAEGCFADFVVFDDELKPRKVALGGRWQ
ncbi:MAG TPA: amidohydrolase family protein [Kribbella sp.]|uniref:N-acetylglucosamine-6-phosphate deacetylase n=1 Tax=Kribbella sp. TaxID=1871183 RepID=UPI002D779611|nr:amidohydrolase family protein [Kribbella sp.]HET6298596.1 amidohydrolase family protein [Kribbella sp.]